MPRESAHNGTIDCRVARAAEMSITPVPSVSRTRRCSASTDRTERWAWAAAVASRRRCLVTSGRKAHSTAAATLTQAAKAYAAGDAPARDDHGSDERPEKQADPERAAEGRHAASAQTDRDRLGRDRPAAPG